MEKRVGKSKLKSAVLYSVIILIWVYLLFAADIWKGMRAFCIVLVIVVIGIIIPGISYCQLMWRVDQERLYYTYHRTFLDKVTAFYSYVFNRKHIYQIAINLNQIDYIDVSYAKVPRMPFGGYGYDLLFIVHMYDGSIYQFDALITRNRQEFNEAVDFLQAQGVQIHDPLKILDYLKTGSYLSYYLEKLEEQSHD